MTGIAQPILFLSDCRGIAIPRDFAEQIHENAVIDYGKWKEKLASLADMDSEGYWDTWDDICQNMIVKDIHDSYKHYYLHQDGDLWLRPHPKSVKWVTDKEELDDNTLHDMYDEMLDDCYGNEVKIAGHDYRVNLALKRVDKTAYNTCFNNWLDGKCRGENIFELDDKYYSEDPEEPDDYWGDPESHDGHYEWKETKV
jgi:hypothetical protein